MYRPTSKFLKSSSNHLPIQIIFKIEMTMASSPTISLPLSLSDIQLIILAVGLVEFLLFHLLTAAKTLHASLPSLRPSPPPIPAQPQPIRSPQPSLITGGDAAVALSSLGMIFGGGAAELDGGDLLEMFEEVNPSLGEVKEAFEVFDLDRDGFIDAEELQRVVCSLGFKEGLEIGNCRRMIALGDEDGDGRIDFQEFLRFMERNLC